MTHHTRGPWKANGLPNSRDPTFRYAHAVYAGNTFICSTNDPPSPKYQTPEDPEQHANANLIAAAPDLLDACRQAFNLSCDRAESRVKWTARDQLAHEALAAALRKARDSA